MVACGAGRGIVADKHGTIIGGNKSYETAQALGLPTVRVETTGQALVVVQRLDLDLAEDAKARQLAYYDNRVSELDLQWDPRQLQTDLLNDVPLGLAFFPNELSALVTDDLDPHAALDPLPAPVTTTKTAKATPISAPTFVLTFHTVAQQLQWAAFQKALRARYPDLPESADRLAQYLTTLGIGA
jgi:hypothetical protein